MGFIDGMWVQAQLRLLPPSEGIIVYFNEKLSWNTASVLGSSQESSGL